MALLWCIHSQFSRLAKSVHLVRGWAVKLSILHVLCLSDVLYLQCSAMSASATIPYVFSLSTLMCRLILYIHPGTRYHSLWEFISVSLLSSNTDILSRYPAWACYYSIVESVVDVCMVRLCIFVSIWGVLATFVYIYTPVALRMLSQWDLLDSALILFLSSVFLVRRGCSYVLLVSVSVVCLYRWSCCALVSKQCVC